MYEISNNTYALLIVNPDSAKVIEEGKELFINQPVHKIISSSCRYFGSTLEGRMQGTKEMININYKPPIIIEESREMIFFPITSSFERQFHWIALHAVKNYQSLENQTLITFQNGELLTLPVSFSSFDNQYLRATKLLMILRRRKQQN